MGGDKLVGKELLGLEGPLGAVDLLSSSPIIPPLAAPHLNLPLPGLMEPWEDQGISTQLLAPSGSVCFSYANAPWRLFLRKEVSV